MNTLYKITSINDSDKFYLVFSMNKGNKYQILHNFIYKYTQSMKKNITKTIWDDAFIIIQKNNVVIEKVAEFENKINCNNYIIREYATCENCMNYKHDEYVKNDTLEIFKGAKTEKCKKKKQKNQEYYKRKKEKKNNN